MNELKDQYYDIKNIRESELEVIEADLQRIEDRLEDLEVRIRDILSSLIAKCSVSSVHNHENAISQANSKLKLEIKLPEKPLPLFRGSSDKFEEKSYCGLAINAEIYSDNLNQQLRAFWEIERVDESSLEHSLEEEICETQYQNTHYRTEEGRYVVQ
ncbi:hypothetical protein TNCV_3363701 [Trichonephila clavipes]|nr:hypothetical protein TNCV_3363701 [Trichonephila clavipes]